MARFSRQDNEAYLESSWTAMTKLYDRAPYVTREGMEIQIKEALARKPGASLKVEDIVDDSIVKELEATGFIGRVYKQ